MNEMTCFSRSYAYEGCLRERVRGHDDDEIVEDDAPSITSQCGNAGVAELGQDFACEECEVWGVSMHDA